MQGFEARWRDFPDYIIGITYDIWERRGVARLHDWYAEDLIFRMASGIGVGRQAVIEGTLATMHEFPDRELLAEDVIWSGTPEQGMLSSHRLYCQGHYRGDGQFGPAKGQPVAFAPSQIAMRRTIRSTMNGLPVIRAQSAVSWVSIRRISRAL